MRFIPTRIHGILDYLIGVWLILSPWILDFDVVPITSPWILDFGSSSSAQLVPIFVGIAVIIYSLLTNYELGLFKTIPMSTHLVLDIIGGAILAISPWLFGFSDLVYWPHLIIGILMILAGLMTHTRPTYDDFPPAYE